MGKAVETGCMVAGGIAAVVEALRNVVAHHCHEKIRAVLRLRVAWQVRAGGYRCGDAGMSGEFVAKAARRTGIDL